jgi:hypothetical protein
MAGPRSARGGLRPGLAILMGLLAGCSEDPAPDDALQAVRPPEIVRIVPAGEALAGAHIPTLDLAPMTQAEIRRALGEVARCVFRYTSTGRPVLAMKASSGGSPGDAVVKLNDDLVLLTALSGDGGLALHADDVRLRLTPVPGQALGEGQGQKEADLVFEVGSGLTAGYRGYYSCSAPET